MRKGWILAALLLATAGGAYYYYAYHAHRPQPAPGAAAPATGPEDFPVQVEARPVRVGTVIRTAEAVGNLLPNESVAVRPEIPGRVVAIGFEEGKPVRKGAVLVKLDDSIHQAELAQARANLALSEVNYERTKELLRKGTATQRAHDEALNALEVSKAAVAVAAARLEKTKIVAPFDGVMGLRQVSVGDYVREGDTLTTLDAIDVVKVDFRVPELYLPKVETGQEIVLAVDALPGEKFAGKVYAIDPVIDVNGRNLVIRAVVANDKGKLRPGLFARVTLILERRENAILVPEEALVPTGKRQFVFRIVGGKAVLTEVEVGQRQGTEVEIVKGLEPGAVVVTAGQIKLRDGAKVVVAGESA